MGTRFIATQENTDWHPAYAERILAAGEGDDTVAPGVYGPARLLRNDGVRQLERLVASGSSTRTS
jgi:NAD(P)H-dependent flavin oxidoreductase YrpB (nitropropane dioxygenase family)